MGLRLGFCVVRFLLSSKEQMAFLFYDAFNDTYDWRNGFPLWFYLVLGSDGLGLELGLELVI